MKIEIKKTNYNCASSSYSTHNVPPVILEYLNYTKYNFKKQQFAKKVKI